MISFKAVAVSDPGDTLLISGRPGHRIVLVSLMLVASDAMTIAFGDTTGYPVVGGMAFAANGGMTAQSADGLAQCETGAGLNINVTGSGSVGGTIGFRFVKG